MSSSSGPGGGRGRGCGREGVRRAGCAPRVLPPTLLEGDRSKSEATVADVVGGSPVSGRVPDPGPEPEPDAPGEDATPSPSDWCSSCAVNAVSTFTSSSGSDAGRASGLFAEVSRLRERISGLCRARLDLVGDAKEGRAGDRDGDD